MVALDDYTNNLYTKKPATITLRIPYIIENFPLFEVDTFNALLSFYIKESIKKRLDSLNLDYSSIWIGNLTENTVVVSLSTFHKETIEYFHTNFNKNE